MGTLSDLLLNQAYEDLSFQPSHNRYLELFNFKVSQLRAAPFCDKIQASVFIKAQGSHI
jgi:hypothetical protein